MTLAQLQSFVLVARHGSVKAAAAELEVTEPAVSVAVAALRKELGDELFVRRARHRADARRPAARRAGERDPGARRAGAPVGAGGRGRRRQVVATSVVAEHIGPLIEPFGARDEGLEIAVEAGPGPRSRNCSSTGARHRARPAPGLERAATIASAPFLRCRLIVVAAPEHPLAGARRSRPRRWPGSAGSSGSPRSTR